MGEQEAGAGGVYTGFLEIYHISDVRAKVLREMRAYSMRDGGHDICKG